MQMGAFGAPFRETCALSDRLDRFSREDSLATFSPFVLDRPL